MIIDYDYLPREEGLRISYLDTDGNLNWITPNRIPLYPYVWEKCAEDDPEKHPYLKSWDKMSVKKVSKFYPNKYCVGETLINLNSEIKDKILAFPKKPDITFVDIETAKGKDGYSSPDVASLPITLITMIKGDKVIIMGYQKLDIREQEYVSNQNRKYFEKFGRKIETKFMTFTNESYMLSAFLKAAKSLPVITGWNFIEYDWLYIVTRARRLKIDPAICAPFGRLKPQKINTKSGMITVDIPEHKLIVDYMQLYDTYAKPKVKNISKKLDYVAEVYLGVKKVDYEKDLQNLMENDYKQFCHYGAVDTILVQLIHRKTKFFNILATVGNITKNRASDALSVVKTTEGLLQEGMLKNEQMVMMKADPGQFEEMELKGGWVMNAHVGYHTNVVCFDFASLYPFTQQIFNIGSETFVGIIKEDGKYIETLGGKYIERESHHIITDYIDEKETIRAVFDNSKDGITKSTLSDTYKNRKSEKVKMFQAKDRVAEIKKKIKYLKEKNLSVA